MSSTVISKQRNHSNAPISYSKLPTLPLASTRCRLTDWIHWSYCHTKRLLLSVIARVLPESWLSKQSKYSWISPWSTCTWCRPRWQVICSGSTGALTYESAAIQALWYNGFFGKGVVSRGEPFMLVDDLKDTIEERVVTSTSTATATAIVGRRTRRRRKAKQSMPPAISAEKQQILFQSMMMSSCSSQSINTEPLWLAPEELFYLTWQTGSLHVIDQITKECLDPWQLWLRCCQAYRPRNINTKFSTMSNNDDDDNDDTDNVANHTFVARYAVYRYLREKDWIVRDGIKYGADYVIYKKGPIFDHSVAAILVCPVVIYNSSNVHKDSYDNVLVNYNRRVSLDWINLLGLLRVCNQVRKVLHICFVYIPMMDDDDDTWRYQEPMDIQSYRIEEVIIKRWVPERNRS